MRFKTFLLSASLAGAMFTACTYDEISIPKSELYAREFIRQFGVIDPKHDLSAARHSSVTVVTSSPADVSVCADIGGHRYLFAEGRAVSGTTTLSFDLPAGVSEVIVSSGQQSVRTSLGSTVRLTGALKAPRTVMDPSAEGGAGLTAQLCTDPKDWMVVPLLNATIFRRKMPENCYNAYREGVDNDFMLKFKKNDIVIRPLYWQTNQNLEFGLFYLDDEGKPVHCPVYKMEKNTENSPVDELALCWVPSETKSITVKDFMNNELFMKCLAHNGIQVVDRTSDEGPTYKYISVYSLDNFLGSTTSECDRDMTLACREYLDSIGIKNDPLAPVDSRFNYVYRWRMIGDHVQIRDQWNQLKDVYDQSFIAQKRRDPRKDIEIVYTYYNYDYENKAKGWSNNNDMVAGIKMDDENYPSLISKGIKVHLDDIDRAYGGYIKDNGIYRYSFSSLNESTRWIPGKDAERTDYYYDPQSEIGIYRYPTSAFVKDPAHKAFRSVTWVGTKYAWRYMSFEDGIIGDTYSRESCDFDMQDFVFILDDDTEIYHDPVEEIIRPEPDPEPYQWLIAAEDLAGSYDWDFNDVVFGVSATSIVDGEDNNATKTEITVEPLAAGGTLPVYIMFNGNISLRNADGTFKNLGLGHYNIGPELHSWFGGYYRTPINVDGPEATATGTPLTFVVDGDWSLTDNYQNNPQWEQQQDVKGMGGFYVLVNPGNTLRRMEKAIVRFEDNLLDDKNHFHMVTPPSSFDKQDQVVFTPEMLCLENHWCWPQEEQPIHTVYYKFEDWLKDATVGWYVDPASWDEKRVVRRK